MLRKVNWTVLGIAGLSLLMCGGCAAEAQSQPAAQQGQAGQQALPPGEAAGLWKTVGELRAEVSQLRQEVARLRAQVADTGVGGSGTTQGTGGAGAAGTGQGTGAQAGTGTRAGQGVSDVPPAGSGVPSPQGTAVVNAVYTGVVRSVSGQRVVINLDDGAPLPLDVDARTRVLRGGRNIGVRQLEQGEQVRAVVDLVGQDQTLEIAVLPAAAPEE